MFLLKLVYDLRFIDAIAQQQIFWWRSLNSKNMGSERIMVHIAPVLPKD
ncbi:hypothetical protein [Chroogloeocystis siderophila]|nr:hypothetical protein [Chroogloeocystis siderophila]